MRPRGVRCSDPMSLNGLLTGCNQKTSRDPVMNLSDAEAQEALNSLKLLTLAFESSGTLRNTVQRLCTELGISPDFSPMSPPGQE